MTIDQERLGFVLESDLGSESHPHEIPGQWCVMEAVAYVAREDWSDSPQCVCPVIASLMRSWNDGLSDEYRTAVLRPLIPLLFDTRGHPYGRRFKRGLEGRRIDRILDWLVREHVPELLDLLGLSDAAAGLRELPVIVEDEHLLAEARDQLMSVVCRLVSPPKLPEEAALTEEEMSKAALAALRVESAVAPAAAARHAAVCYVDHGSSWYAVADAARCVVENAVFMIPETQLDAAVTQLQRGGTKLVQELCAMKEMSDEV